MKFEVLKDGTEVLLREPTIEDLERSLQFFKTLPAEDRRYLRNDVTKQEIVERRIRQIEQGAVHRIFAFVQDDVVADGALECSGDGWSRHVGEIRVIASPVFQSRGLGTLLIGELFVEAQRRQVEKVIVKMASPQTAGRKICEKLGFHLDGVLPGHIKDAEGNLQDLVVMSCTLDVMWKELKDFYPKDDWPDG